METSELMAEVPAEGLSGPPASMTETRSDEDGRIFHGPYDLQRTLAKYTLSYEGVEDTDHNIRCVRGKIQHCHHVRYTEYVDIEQCQ